MINGAEQYTLEEALEACMKAQVEVNRLDAELAAARGVLSGWKWVRDQLMAKENSAAQ